MAVLRNMYFGQIDQLELGLLICVFSIEILTIGSIRSTGWLNCELFRLLLDAYWQVFKVFGIIPEVS